MPARVPSAMSDLTSSSVIVASRTCDSPSRRSAVSVDIFSSQTIGAITRDRNRIGRAAIEATRSGSASATRFGTSSPNTIER